MSVMLTVKKRRAVQALARGYKVSKVAELAGASERSIYRWMKDSEFIQAVALAESEELRRASRRLAGLLDLATEKLEEMLLSQNMSYRSKAVEMVLRHSNKYLEMVSLETRVSALEERAQGGKL